MQGGLHKARRDSLFEPFALDGPVATDAAIISKKLTAAGIALIAFEPPIKLGDAYSGKFAAIILMVGRTVADR